MDLHYIKLRTPIVEKFKKLWKYYLCQSFLAALALFIIVLILGKGKMVVISAIGATAFIVFAMPTAVSAQTRNVFIMVALDVEHSPAAGTALAVVINEVSPDVFVTIMASAVILSQCRYYLRHHLKDLI